MEDRIMEDRIISLLDVTTNICLKSCAYHPDSKCCTFFHRNLSYPKSSEDILLYLYVI